MNDTRRRRGANSDRRGVGINAKWRSQSRLLAIGRRQYSLAQRTVIMPFKKSRFPVARYIFDIKFRTKERGGPCTRYSNSGSLELRRSPTDRPEG